MLMENRENQDNDWNSKKIIKMHAKRKNGSKRVCWNLDFTPQKKKKTPKDGIFKENWNYLVEKWFENSIQDSKFPIKEANRWRDVHQEGHIRVQPGNVIVTALLVVTGATIIMNFF